MPRDDLDQAAEAERPYDRYAAAYRDWWGPVIAPSAVRVLDRLELAAGDARPFELLDVGTGTGTLAIAALERWPHVTVTGVDLSNRMLDLAEEEAERRGPDIAGRLRLLSGSADRLPLPAESVDAAASSFMIQLVSSRAAASREVARVLRRGGRFACVTWQAESEAFEPDEMFLVSLDELEIESPPFSRDARPYTTPQAAAAELRRAGFANVSAGVEWLEHNYTPQSFLDILEHWMESDLFDALDRRKRQRLRSDVLRRLFRLPREAFTWRRPLISVVGERR